MGKCVGLRGEVWGSVGGGEERGVGGSVFPMPPVTKPPLRP